MNRVTDGKPAGQGDDQADGDATRGTEACPRPLPLGDVLTLEFRASRHAVMLRQRRCGRNRTGGIAIRGYAFWVEFPLGIVGQKA